MVWAWLGGDADGVGLVRGDADGVGLVRGRRRWCGGRRRWCGPG